MLIFNNYSNIFFPLFSRLTGESTVEINAGSSRQSVSKSRVLKSTGKSVGFFVILHDKLTKRFFGLISVLRPFNTFKIISGVVSYPNHTVPGQASLAVYQYQCTLLRQ